MIKEYYNRLKSSKHMRQSFSLMCWNFASIPLALVTNIVVTRYLGAESYGNYLYFQKVFDFVYIILNFGLLRSVNRAILLDKDGEKTKELYGSGLALFALLYLVITIALFAFALISPDLKTKGIQSLFLCIIPFSFIHFLIQYFEQVLPPSNNINYLIIERYVPKICFFVIAVILYFSVVRKSFGWNPIVVIWCSFLSTQLLVYLFLIRKIRPSFRNLRSNLRAIGGINREFGVQIYVGDLFSTAFTALMPILLSLVSDSNTGVGLYSLSLMLSTPLSFIPAVIATSNYQSFAGYKFIPKNILRGTFIISIVALVGLWIVVTPFVNIFYTEEYHPVIVLTLITSVGTLLYGISDFFSRYLLAQGKGKYLRNSSFVVGFGTLVLSLVLIPLLKATGAAITHVAAGLLYLAVILVYYRRTITENQNCNKL